MLQGQRILEAAEKRWEQLLERRSELGSTVAIQRLLLNRSLGLADFVEHAQPVQLQIAPARVADKLESRKPVLVGQAIAVSGESLTSFLVGFCDDLSVGEAGEPASRLARRLNRREIDLGSLIASSLGRQQEAIREKAHHVGVSPDLLWLVAELTAGPIACWLRREVLFEHPAVETLLAGWREGFCPACGSWPAFAEHTGNNQRSRTLRCSFCGLGWTPPVHRCIYCDEHGPAFVMASPEPGDETRRLEMCQRCGGYLKGVEVAEETPFALLPVVDLETSDLDVGATTRGYGRPPMHDFQSAGTVPCPPIIES